MTQVLLEFDTVITIEPVAEDEMDQIYGSGDVDT